MRYAIKNKGLCDRLCDGTYHHLPITAWESCFYPKFSSKFRPKTWRVSETWNNWQGFQQGLTNTSSRNRDSTKLRLDLDSASQKNPIHTSYVHQSIALWEIWHQLQVVFTFLLLLTKLKTMSLNRTRDHSLGSQHLYHWAMLSSLLCYAKLCMNIKMCDSHCDRTSALFPRPCLLRFQLFLFLDNNYLKHRNSRQ